MNSATFIPLIFATLCALLTKELQNFRSALSPEIGRSFYASPSPRVSADTLLAQHAPFHFLPVITGSAGECNPLAGRRGIFAG